MRSNEKIEVGDKVIADWNRLTVQGEVIATSNEGQLLQVSLRKSSASCWVPRIMVRDVHHGKGYPRRFNEWMKENGYA